MRLMILGAGNCQLNLIKRAKIRGHYVIVADYLDDPPGAQFADDHIKISTFDTGLVLQAATENRIEGIVTLGTDQPVLTAAVIAKKLGLHFYAGSYLALAVTNKRIMKELFAKNKIPMNDYRLIGKGFTKEDIKGLKFPAVLKPVDSQGQRGIFKVKNIEEVRKNIEETLFYSREEKALLEEFYRSDEITVNGWAGGGTVKIISIVDRLTMKQTNRIGICIGHSFPSLHLKGYYKDIERITQDIADAFGITDGPIYFQYLIGSKGVRVNEIAMRIGGAYEDLTIPIISGIDIAGMLLDYIETGKCDTRALEKYSILENKKYVSTQMFFLQPGKIAGMTPEQEVMQLDGVRDVYYAVKEGDIAAGIENATARAGYVIVEGESFDELNSNIDKLYENMKVFDENGKNLVISFNEYKEKYLFV